MTRVGTKLYLDGQPYRFAGLNIYSANSDWSFNFGCGSNYGQGGNSLDDQLTKIGSGQSAFRAWFFQGLATNTPAVGGPSRNWTAFDRTLAVAAAHGQKVVATLGNQWGDCEEQPGSTYRSEAWYRGGYKTTPMNPQVTASYRDWVKEVVTRYRDNPAILMWQLMNEAEISNSSGCGSAASLKSFADDVSGLIKSIDRNHLVSLGEMGDGQCGMQAADYRLIHSGPNIDLCEFHDYTNTGVAVPPNLGTDLSVCAALGKPVFVGEIQTSGYASPAARSADLDAKMAAQFGAGVVGFLPWNWTGGAGSAVDGDIGPGDPFLAMLAKY